MFLIDLPSLRLYGVLYGAPSVLQNMRGEPVSSGAVRTFLTVSPHARHMSSVTGANLSHSYQSSLSTLPSPLLTPHTASSRLDHQRISTEYQPSLLVRRVTFSGHRSLRSVLGGGLSVTDSHIVSCTVHSPAVQCTLCTSTIIASPQPPPAAK